MPLYSYSKISCYETCPLQYKLHYIDGIDRETESIEAFMGSRVHETLEKLYKDLMHSRTPSISDLCQCYDELWNNNWNNSIKIVRAEYNPEDYKESGRKCIINYYKRYKPFDQETTLALEKLVEIYLDDEEKYKLSGKIDRLARTEDGVYEIHDYKTSQYLPSQKELDEDIQLPLYQIAVESLWKDVDETALVWHFLVHDKEMRSSRTKKEIQKLKVEILEKVNEIEESKEFKANESPLCDWCDYQDLCPSRKHMVKVIGLPTNEFLEEGGVHLVNRYAELTDARKELDDKIEKLREAIFAYAKKEGVDIMVGSDNKLRIKIEMVRKFPKRDEEEYVELANLLKGSGKWIDVSDLNPWTLREYIECGKWDKDLVEKVLRYQRLEEKRNIWMSKIRK